MNKILTSPYRFIKWLFAVTTIDIRNRDDNDFKYAVECVIALIIMFVHWVLVLTGVASFFNPFAAALSCIIIIRGAFEYKKILFNIPLDFITWILFLWSFTW